MSNKIIQISFDVEDPLDKTLWEYLKGLPKESRRQFVFQSLLLNMQLPPIYQLCFLQKLLSGVSVPTSVTVNNSIDSIQESVTEPNIPVKSTGKESNISLDRSQFAI